MWARASIVALICTGCLPMTPEVVGRTTTGRNIVQMPLTWSNTFLIEGERPVLIDAGSSGDELQLELMLATRGVRVEDLNAVIITHGHADHSGLGATLQRRIAGPVILGSRDVPTALAGRDNDLIPTSLFAELLKLVVPLTYDPFTPDIAVSDRYDLRALGLPGEIVALPGHTPGSLVVLLEGGIAFCGDQLRGGEFAGALHPEIAFEHYYHDDRVANLRNIQWMLDRGVQTFYVGHGGPVPRQSVIDLVAP